MPFRTPLVALAGMALVGAPLAADDAAETLPPLKYNNLGLVVELHVGLWAMPIPCDFDGDGDYDLLVNCPDKPTRAIVFFENVDGPEAKFPTFKPGVPIAKSLPDLTPSYGDDGEMTLLSRNRKVVRDGDTFRTGEKVYKYDQIRKLSAAMASDEQPVKIRARSFGYADYDGDGLDDLVVGIGDWTDYGMNFSTGSGGWSNAYSSEGVWQPGPLHGYVYVLRNTGTADAPKYAAAQEVLADGEPVDVYGRPSPSFADFDGDGDLDLLCGEFLDGFTYFRNIGSRTEPDYAAGVRLTHRGQPLTLDLQMIVPVAFDWDRDGDHDLIVGDEDGRIALVEHLGTVDANGTPEFAPPVYFRQHADDVVIGALVTPVAVDWDGDGDTDLVCGNSAGHIQFLENLGGEGQDTKWAAPAKLEADKTPIRPMAGYNGSVQGPSEQKWGYTTLDVADWNDDDLPDLVVNSVWGKVVWYENVGTRTNPLLTAGRPVVVDRDPSQPAPRPEGYWWQPQGRELVTQWRTTPLVIDWNDDGRADLVMLDHEGYFALFERTAAGVKPPRRIFRSTGPSVFDSRHRAESDEAGLLRLTSGVAGRGGRRKLAFGDWNGDGHVDLLVNSLNVDWLEGTPDGDEYVFTPRGPLSTHELAGHTTSPTVWDWNGDGRDDIVLGAEDGKLYWLANDGGGAE